MRRRRTGSGREPTIALINVVFLMLVFFMVAGRLAPPLDPDLRLVETAGLEGREPPDALIVTAAGEVRFRGAPVDIAAHVGARKADAVVRIVPDRALDAARLVAVAAELRAAGADTILIVTEQALP